MLDADIKCVFFMEFCADLFVIVGSINFFMGFIENPFVGGFMYKMIIFKNIIYPAKMH